MSLLIFFLRYPFEYHIDQSEALQTIQSFIYFADRVFAVGLQLERDNTLLMHYVLSFYELVCIHKGVAEYFIWIFTTLWKILEKNFHVERMYRYLKLINQQNTTKIILA